jgi:HAD superfamily hydrolase (TIGR01549 family)
MENTIMNRMVKNIVIDYDGVFIPVEYQSIKQLCPDVQLLEKIETPYYTKVNGSLFWEELKEAFQLSISSRELITIYNSETEKQKAHEQKLIGFLISFSSQYSFFLLSNQITNRTNYIRRKKNLSFFKKMYFSNEIGFAKPDRKAFEYVLNDQCLKPTECLFIDDMEENISTAKELGMETMLFTTIDTLKNEKIFTHR